MNIQYTICGIKRDNISKLVNIGVSGDVQLYFKTIFCNGCLNIMCKGDRGIN